MVVLVRSGRDPEELAKEFEPSAQSIRNWVAQAERDAGHRPDGLPTTGHVAAYLGLVPREWSSGERQQRGGITKTGNRRARALLIQAAWGGWRDRHPASAGLRQWAERLAARRSRRIAIVALARRLAGILFALWRDNTPFEAARLGQRPARPAVAA